MNPRDPAAFGDIYRTHARSILIFLTRRTYDPETALDLTAETFALAFASRRRYRGSTDDELAAWLFGIARHVLSRFIRKGRAERRALERLGVEVPAMEPDEIARVVELAPRPRSAASSAATTRASRRLCRRSRRRSTATTPPPPPARSTGGVSTCAGSSSWTTRRRARTAPRPR